MKTKSSAMRALWLCASAVVVCGSAWIAAGADGSLPRHIVRPADAAAASSLYYTTYEASATSISWVTCGYNPQSEGCFGSGTLGTFGQVCSVAGSSGIVVVADSEPPAGDTAISVYRQIEGSTPSATLLHKVRVPIASSAAAKCFMAVGGNFVYFGTNKSPAFYQVNLTTAAIVSGSGCGGNTSAITASNNFVVVSQSGCFTGYDDSGNVQEDGGEFTDEFVPSTDGYAPTFKTQ